MGGFVHLHVHSEYSLLDGACRINQIISRAKELGQTAVAITDHGSMYGVVDFYKAAKKEGIKPIIGCEVYVAPRSRFDKVHEFDSETRHLVLLCKNNVGYQNLIKMVSKAFTEGFYNKPRIDEQLLSQHSEGLIALSACLAGEIPRALIGNDYDKAKEKALEYNKIFGQDNFYLELQDHGIKEQTAINPMLIRLSRETGIPLVATNDCHYIAKEDNKMHHILLCIQTNHTVEDDNAMEFSSKEFYFKSEEEMRILFPACQEAIDNTVKIAEMCNMEFNFGNTKLPHFEIPNGMDNFEYFKENCYKGLHKHYGMNPDKMIMGRLEYELSTINQMGYVDYYLIVHDFVSYARSAGIAVGPGRGSGAGSLAAYCMGITNVDPIKYNLLFERFLNPERISMPDFDIDFCYERRQEVIDYVIRKYGEDHVAQIITFGTMAARGAIRDVGRAMAVPYSVVDTIAKLIPAELGITITKALNNSKDLKDRYENDPQIHELLEMARKVEGMPRHASTHAAGVVITKEAVNHYVPLAKNDEAIVTQFTMTTLEELGLLKMDFLGLRTLTVIKDAEKMVKVIDPNFNVEDIPLDDKEVFEMFSNGRTEGVFQFESAGMKNVLTQLKPEHLEDLIAVISLYRPGPMDSISTYVENKHNPGKVSYMHPLLSKILDVTYGCIIYQEQVMQIFRTLAGYSLGRADIVRRAMSKKKVHVMEQERNVFIHGLTNENGKVLVDGCIRRGVTESIANSIYNQMENFASYAFNKSHAVAYAVISYQTAYMKRKYPKEYMAALLTSVLDNSSKVAEYIEECNKLGIKVLPAHVNYSNNGFTVSDCEIRFGLLAIKNLGRGTIKALIDERKLNGNFDSLYDFCKRMHKNDLNKRSLESLIKAGALDNLGANRRQMLMSYESITDSLNLDKRQNLEGQIGFFDIPNIGKSDINIDLPKLDEFPLNDLLSMEKDVTGMYLSGHPLYEYNDIIKAANLAKISDLVESGKGLSDKYKDKDYVNILAIISSVKIKITKNNSTMAFINIEDMSGTTEAIIFPKVLSECSYHIRENNIVKIEGKLNISEEDGTKIICDRLSAVDKDTKFGQPENCQFQERKGLYIKVPCIESEQYNRAKLLLSIFEGNTPVYFFFDDTKKLMLSPSSLWVSYNDVLVRELKYRLGDKNIAIK